MKFLFSSLGKKVQIALTGILLATFLIFHLINNLVLFTGKENFNEMVGLLESIKPLIRVMEAGLLFIIITHVVNAVYLTFSNKKAAANRYSVDASATSSVNSRTMIISGTIILLFFIIHLRYIWFTYQAHLKHGVQSALKTLGLTENSKWKVLYSGSILIWGIIPLAFISIILSIQLGIIK